MESPEGNVAHDGPLSADVATPHADSLASCINRCEELCAYFPNNPECKMQSARCVFRCKGAKEPH